ncbi:ATP-dependent RNA helicase Mss116p, mitochondrial [[Candida] anglica]|uniref:ATP-dependent RNA helicase n=1 Tax=[Candida] anglica TaxID=148631 RepID=A0ABP0EKA1_9ASCO
MNKLLRISRLARVVLNQQVLVRSTPVGVRCFATSPVWKNEIKAEPVKIEQTSESTTNQESTTNEKPEATSEAAITPEDLFEQGLLHKDIYRAIIPRFKTLTPVQQRTIGPALTTDKGVVARARTGTGKTLAFGIPILQFAYANKETSGKIHSLIITPTRDLAFQIRDELTKIIKNLPERAKKQVRIDCHVGGTRANRLRTREVPSILIATPGRLRANLENREFVSTFSDLKFRVYDEADRLLEAGFAEELYSISRTLESAQEESAEPFRSLLFSATVDNSVDKFAKRVLGNDYQFIDCVDKDAPEAHANIEQTLVKTANITESIRGSLSFIMENIHNPKFKVILFVPTTAAADFFYGVISDLVDKEASKSKLDTTVHRLHGKLTQSARDRAVKKFHYTTSGILVTTDVSARGLDFRNISDIVQVAPSSTPADYIHKIGRTARAGKTGKAVIFLSKSEGKFVRTLASSRKIKFDNEYDYVPSDKNDAAIIESVANLSITNVELFMKSMLAFQKSIQTKYQLPFPRIVQQHGDLFRYLVNNSEAKIQADQLFVKRVLSLRGPEVNATFDLMDRKEYLRKGPALNKGFQDEDSESDSRSERRHYGNSYGNDRPQRSYGEGRPRYDRNDGNERYNGDGKSQRYSSFDKGGRNNGSRNFGGRNGGYNNNRGGRSNYESRGGRDSRFDKYRED